MSETINTGAYGTKHHKKQFILVIHNPYMVQEKTDSTVSKVAESPLVTVKTNYGKLTQRAGDQSDNQKLYYSTNDRAKIVRAILDTFENGEYASLKGKRISVSTQNIPHYGQVEFTRYRTPSGDILSVGVRTRRFENPKFQEAIVMIEAKGDVGKFKPPLNYAEFNISDPEKPRQKK